MRVRRIRRSRRTKTPTYVLTTPCLNLDRYFVCSKT